jgi:hypothetical protein
MGLAVRWQRASLHPQESAILVGSVAAALVHSWMQPKYVAQAQKTTPTLQIRRCERHLLSLRFFAAEIYALSSWACSPFYVGAQSKHRHPTKTVGYPLKN